jgi:hypothetical protein
LRRIRASAYGFYIYSQTLKDVFTRLAEIRFGAATG